MANFEVRVYKLEILPHPNADLLELAKVGDYLSIVGKGQFETGDFGVYIPEGSIVPHWILEQLKLVNKLAGKEKNRVKAIKIRNILSQGLIFPLAYVGPVETDDRILITPTDSRLVREGDDVTHFLDITKYEPPIPIHMQGEVFNAFGYTINFDIEDIKRYNEVLQDNEQVVFSEKLHGTFCCIGFHPNIPHPIVHSKRLGAQGLAFKLNDVNQNNLYVRTLNNIMETKQAFFEFVDGKMWQNTPIYFLGEIFGNVQDLKYGIKDVEFRVFDIYEGIPGNGRYVNFYEKLALCDELDLDMVPILYRGPFSKEKVNEFTNGLESISGNQLHICEGIVITPIIERSCEWLSRVILKSISEDYLIRNSIKEEEVTEFS